MKDELSISEMQKRAIARVARLSDKELRYRMARHRAFHDRFGVYLEHDYVKMIEEKMRREKR